MKTALLNFSVMSKPAFLGFKGQIHLIDSDEQMNQAISILRQAKHLGFDTETRPSFKVGEVYPVAQLQLATETDAFVIRLKNIRQFAGLKDIFENEEIIKVGAAIAHDLKQLQKIFKFEHKGFLEIQKLAKAKGLKNFGLKGMAEEVFQASITKGPKLTNWDAAVLTSQQIQYAATDAWIGLKIYHALKAMVVDETSSPK
jgi:ribonuclease D